MRQVLPVILVVLLAAAVSTLVFIWTWGPDALFLSGWPMPLRYLGTMLGTIFSPYMPLALPMSFRQWFGPGEGVMAVVYWPFVVFCLWRWFTRKNWLYFIGFAAMILGASPYWLYFSQSLSGI